MAISNTVKTQFPNPISGLLKNTGNRSSTPALVPQRKIGAPLASVTPGKDPITGLVQTPKPAAAPGAYKGTPITPGTTEQIMQQMQQIDANASTNAANAEKTANAAKPTATVTTKSDGKTGTTSTTTVKGLFSDVVSSLAKKGMGESKPVADAQKAYQDSIENLRKFKESTANTKADIFSDPVSARVMQGRNAAVQQANAEKLGAFQGAVQQAQTGVGLAQNQQSLQQAALGSAAGLAAPTQVPYSNQFIDPLTGQPIGGGGGSLQGAVSGVVDKLTKGEMSYNDALTALAGYGQGGVNALQAALPQGFNIAQSNTLAGQQGSIGVQYQLAETALKNVESILGELGALQTTNVPSVNRAANWFSTQFGIGSEQTRAMTGAVQSLRNAYASLLASVKGGTPTDYSNQAMAEIPAEPTPNDLAAIRKNFEVLGQARKNILGNPGQAGGNTNTGGGLFDW